MPATADFTQNSSVLIGKDGYQILNDFNHDGNIDIWEIKAQLQTIRFDTRINSVFRRLTITSRRAKVVQTTVFIYDEKHKSYRAVSFASRPYKTYAFENYENLESEIACGLSSPDATSAADGQLSDEIERIANFAAIESGNLIDSKCKTDDDKQIFRKALNHFSKISTSSDAQSGAFQICLSKLSSEMEALRLRAESLSLSRIPKLPAILRCEGASAEKRTSPSYDEKNSSIVLPTTNIKQRNISAEIDHELLHRIGIESDDDIRSIQQCCPMGTSKPVDSCSRNRTTLAEQVQFLEQIAGTTTALFEFFAGRDLESANEGKLHEKFRVELAKKYASLLERKDYETCRSPNAVESNSMCALATFDLLAEFSSEFIKTECEQNRGTDCQSLQSKHSSTLSQKRGSCLTTPQGPECRNFIVFVTMNRDKGAVGVITGASNRNSAAAAYARQLRSNGEGPTVSTTEQPVLGATINYDNTRVTRETLQKAEEQSSHIVRTAEGVSDWIANRFTPGSSRKTSDSKPLDLEIPRINIDTESGPKIKGASFGANVHQIELPSSDSRGATGRKAGSSVWDDNGESVASDARMPKVRSAAIKAEILGAPLVFEGSFGGLQAAASGISSVISNSGSRRGGSRGTAAVAQPEPPVFTETILPDMRKSYSSIQSIVEDPVKKAGFEKFLIENRIRIITPDRKSIPDPKTVNTWTPKIRFIYDTYDKPPKERKVGR